MTPLVCEMVENTPEPVRCRRAPCFRGTDSRTLIRRRPFALHESGLKPGSRVKSARIQEMADIRFFRVPVKQVSYGRGAGPETRHQKGCLIGLA